MKLDVYYLVIPDEAALASMDKWISSVAKNSTATDGGIRIWLTHVPETATKPFLHARPFDLISKPVKISASVREEYQVSLGAAPKKHMICSMDGDDEAGFEVLMSIVLEVMKRTKQVYLSIDNDLGARLFGPGRFGEPFEVSKLKNLPGAIYEVAHEDDDGELSLEWFVDDRWMRAYQQSRKLVDKPTETFSRFASLDYL